MTFFDPPQPVFRSFFDHLFSRRINTAELSPVKIGTVMHTTTTHLSAFVEPNKSSGGPRNSLLCTKKSTPKTPKTHYGTPTTPTDLLRLRGISSSTLGHMPNPSGPGIYRRKPTLGPQNKKWQPIPSLSPLSPKPPRPQPNYNIFTKHTPTRRF